MSSNLLKEESGVSLSKKRPQRDSNMELFRCFAMFLVLAVHANFFSLSSPTTIELQQAPLPSFTRFFFQSLCIGCVNMFVLISGWYGIRPRLKGFLKLVFQVFFCVTLLYLFLVAAGLQEFGISAFAESVCLRGLGWFVRAYIGLYILSPVLNAFIDNASKRQYEITLASYFLFQCLFGWIVDSISFGNGYSVVSFIFLYLFARYVHIYHLDKIQRCNRNIYLLLFVGLAFILGIVAFVSQYMEIPGASRLYSYTNPLVIFMSASMLFYFATLSFHSRFVNWVAASSLSVYLLHNCLRFSVDKYIDAVRCIYASFSGPICLLVLFVFLVAVYVAATLYDKLRIACWNLIAKRLWA